MNKKLLWLLLFFFCAVAVLVINSTLVYAETVKDAYKSLKKVEAKTQTGVNIRDYSTAISDAKLELNMFIDSTKNKNTPLVQSLKKAMEHYENAASMWRIDITQRTTEVSQVTWIYDAYPQASKVATSQNNYDGGVIVVLDHKIVYTHGVLSIIWAEASKELQRAATLLSK